MTCPKCGTVNDAQYIYCVNCGTSIPGDPSSGYPTASEVTSEKTAYLPAHHTAQPTQQFGQPYTQAIPPARKSRAPILIVSAVALVFLLAAAGVAIWLVNQTAQTAEVLPDHFGVFYLVNDQAKEVSKVETGNLLESNGKLISVAENSISVGTPEIILFAEGTDISLRDLKFIDLESINADGNMKQIEFQTTPVDGKRAMKRLKFPDGLANGKYAFVVFNGSLNDGKHRLWPIQIDGSKKADNNDIAKVFTLNISETIANSNTNAQPTPPTAPSTPKPKVDGPVGSTVAYCNSTDVIVRASAGLNAKRLTMLKKGQRVFVIRYSENTDVWKGTESNWAYVQTESGKRGWVFTPFISNSE